MPLTAQINVCSSLMSPSYQIRNSSSFDGNSSSFDTSSVVHLRSSPNTIHLTHHKCVPFPCSLHASQLPKIHQQGGLMAPTVQRHRRAYLHPNYSREKTFKKNQTTFALGTLLKWNSLLPLVRISGGASRPMSFLNQKSVLACLGLLDQSFVGEYLEVYFYFACSLRKKQG
jgi:hypothetical protein